VVDIDCHAITHAVGGHPFAIIRGLAIKPLARHAGYGVLLGSVRSRRGGAYKQNDGYKVDTPSHTVIIAVWLTKIKLCRILGIPVKTSRCKKA